MKISRLNEIKLVLLLAIALVIFISLLSFSKDDIPGLTSNPNITKNNIIGFVGAYLSWAIIFLTGRGGYVIPFFIAIWGALSLFGGKVHKFYLRVFGAIFLILAVSSICSLVGPGDTAFRFERGGIIGLAFSDFLITYLGTAGTFISISVLLLLSLYVTTDLLLFPLVGWIAGLFIAIIRVARSIPVNLSRRGRPKALRENQRPVKPAINRALAKIRTKEVSNERITKAVVATWPSAEQAGKKETSFVKEPKTEEKRVSDTALPYELPPLSLLTSPPPVEERLIKDNLDESSRILEETLRDFGIETKVVKVSRGPVITRYELEPASGVKIHKITSLSDNIALAMKAMSIRIVAPIPGKGTIGVEVPNSKGALVYLKETLESKEYKEAKSKLKLVLGKDIAGKPMMADLGDMPHLLIAGATGSGKTVCVNGIIATLLFNAKPSELKFLMVDPKRVELAAFNDLPHLLAPVITDSKKVSHALNWAIGEMERRYETFAQLGVRNIEGYNKRSESEDLADLPFIVIIIDELADLMLISQEEVENMITRLAQLSRAVGIHMVIATQRPSVDVITGVIKANFPSRISFKVASKVDSRTVIDMNGAEKLLGRGDMLFMEPGNPKPIRGQASLVGDDEIARITAFIKAQRSADYEEGIVKVEDKPKYKNFERDDIYGEAVKMVMQTRQASVSMLQRRLGVGYTRAARLIDMMEDEGVVGPYQGSKPREILVDTVDEKV
ncbi:MAG: DNA translocase FtsK 4TM domain-containing protein [Candidatus Omnitrophota bacterium]